MHDNAHLGMRHSGGFTMVEIMVVTAIILVLGGILFPVVDNAIEKGRQGDCLSNQRQLAVNILSYAQDDNGLLPLPSDWVAATRLSSDSGLFNCPSSNKKGTGLDPDYGANAFLFLTNERGERQRLPMDRVATPASIELTCDLKERTKAASTNQWRDEFMNPFPESFTVPGFSSFAGTARHGPGVIASFLDGHAELLEGRAMGTSGATQYNIPPGYGRVYLDLSKLDDPVDAKEAMQTFASFAATWQKSTGSFVDGAWEITNGHIMTSAEGQTYDKNCAFNGASDFAIMMVEYDCTPGAKVMMATPNDFHMMSIPVDAADAQHEKLTGSWQTIYHLDTTKNQFQGGLLKAISDQNIYAGYTRNTWVDLPSSSPARGTVQSIPDGLQRIRVEALISFYGGQSVEFPTDPENPKGWVVSSNHNTGKQLYQNVNLTLSSLSTGQPILKYDGPYIANRYSAYHWGRILCKVVGGTVRIRKILWAPSL